MDSMQELSESFEDLFRKSDQLSLLGEKSDQKNLYVSLLTVLFRICEYRLGAIDVLELTGNSVSSTVAALLFCVGSDREPALICGSMHSLRQLAQPVTHFPNAREDEVDLVEACQIFSNRMQSAVTTFVRYKFLELVIALLPRWIDYASTGASMQNTMQNTPSDLHDLMQSLLSLLVSVLLFPSSAAHMHEDDPHSWSASLAR